MKQISVFQQPKSVAEINFGYRFQQYVFGQGLASEMTEAGDRVEKYEVKSTQRDSIDLQNFIL